MSFFVTDQYNHECTEGKCISVLPNPPTASPTTSARIADFWYPQYEISWDQAGCSNTLPLPYNNTNDRPKYNSEESCCASAYGGQVSVACICGLDNPPLGCPGVVEYIVTTTTVTISSTFDLGDLVVPYNQAGFIQTLESTIAALVQASLGADGGTVEKVIILSIDGEPVDRRRALFLRRELTSHANVQFQVLVNNECLGSDCQQISRVNIGSAIRDDVNRGLTNVAIVQTALRQSGNTALQSVSIGEVTVSNQVTSTQTTATTVGVSINSFACIFEIRAIQISHCTILIEISHGPLHFFLIQPPPTKPPTVSSMIEEHTYLLVSPYFISNFTTLISIIFALSVQ